MSLRWPVIGGARRARPTEVPTSSHGDDTSAPRGSIRRRSSSFFFRHPKTRRGLTLAAPLTWMFVVYLVSLVLLLANAFWRVDSLTGQWSATGGGATSTPSSRGTGAPRSSKDVLPDRAAHGRHGGAWSRSPTSSFAFPIAYFAARVATPRVAIGDHDRGRDPPVGELPGPGLRVEGDARGRGAGRGVPRMRSDSRDVSLTGTTFAMWLTFCYLWLPFAILPIYASLERVPDSLHRGIGRPRGTRPDDVPHGGAAAGGARGSSPARSSRSR